MKKNSKYNNHKKENNEKGLEDVSLLTRELLSSLEDNPKVLFVKLNYTGKKSSENGSAYKTRNKCVKILSPSEVEEKAIQDIELMHKTVQKMISSSGKFSTSGIKSSEANDVKNNLVNCKNCKAIFSKKTNLPNKHITSSDSESALQSCIFCDKKFVCYDQDMNKMYGINQTDIKGKNSEETSESSLKTDLDEKEKLNDDWTYSVCLTDLNNGILVDNISEVEVNSDSNESSLSWNPSVSSLTISSNSTDSFRKGNNIDSASLALKIFESKALDAPVINSIHVNNQLSVIEEEDSNFQVKVIVSPVHEEVSFIPESDFVFSSNNNLKLEDEIQLSTNEEDSKFQENVILSPVDENNIDSASLSLTESEKFEAPVISSMNMNNQLSVIEEVSKLQVNVSLSPDDEEVSLKSKSDFVCSSNNNLKLADEKQNRVPVNKYEEQEMVPSSSQNEVLSLKVCCSCLEIIQVMKKIFDKQEFSKLKCHKCPFCGVYYVDNYFERHVGDAHIICNEEKCRSRFILTECQSRKLFMQIKMECIHLNCSHNSHKNNLKHQECDTTNKIESCQDKISSIEVEPAENNKSLLLDNGSPNTEENKVSSSNGFISETSEKSFAEPEAKVGSSELILSCYVCKENFHHEQKLLSHLFNYHRFTHPFTCHICFVCYKFIKELQTHLQTHEEEILNNKATLSFKENGVEDKKEELLDESTQHPQYLESRAQDLPYLESEAQNLQCLESEVDFQLESGVQDLQLESAVQDLQLESEVQDLQLESGVQDLQLESEIQVQLESNLRQDFPVPEELNFLEFNAKDSVEESSKSISDASIIDCNFPEVKVPADVSTFQNEEKQSPKRKRPKISCVVEKVKCPLDIHNLYANIRKMEEFTPEVNPVDVEIQNPSTESKDLLSFEMNADLNTPLKKTGVKRMSNPFSSPAKKMKMNDFPEDSSEKFYCRFCRKTFDLKRSYSSHMFFNHDAVFEDSVVSDLLKPTTRTNETLSDFHKEEPRSEKMEKNSTVEDTETRTCNQCGERYLKVTSYFQHRYDVHGDESSVHVCDNCNKVLITVKKVNSHLCKTVNTFSCNDCGLRFSNGLGLKEHNMLMHFETDGPHTCHECKKCFLTKRMLEKHRRIIHSDNSIISLKEEELNLSAKVSDYKIESGVSEAIENTVTENIESIVNENIESIKEDTEKMLQTVVSPVKATTKKGKIDSLTCPICKMVLKNTNIGRLKAHLIIVHCKATDVCLFCNRIFAFGRGVRHILDFHITPAGESKEYEFSWEGDPRQDVKEAIEVLGLRRLEAISYYDDYATLTDSVSFQCRLCTATYSAVRYYRNHYIQRHDHFCALCGQNFEKNEAFRTHVEEVHNSLKHYLWFAETIISTIVQTERSKGNFETFSQIIKRKLDENEVNAASQLLEQMEDERIASNSTFACKLPEQINEVALESSEIPVSISEPSTELYNKEDILEWPEFSMELEVTDNGTVDIQNPNYCNNEIFVKNDEMKEYTEGNNENRETNDATICERPFDMPNCIFENAISLDDKVVVDLKENEMMTVIASCSADNQMSL